MQATWTTLEHWLGQPLDPEPSLDNVVFRYLAAYGPATTSDIRTWCGLTGLREAVERLRPQLRTFRDERGRELFDVPDGPLPDPETPAPPRFLPEYDNILLSHADRTRIGSDERRERLLAGAGIGPNTFLIDGFVGGTWRITEDRTSATLLLDSLIPLRYDQRTALEEEGYGMLAFAAAETPNHNVEFIVRE
jgi:hypothetical protein